MHGMENVNFCYENLVFITTCFGRPVHLQENIQHVHNTSEDISTIKLYKKEMRSYFFT
jgi:hypothetical protein